MISSLHVSLAAKLAALGHSGQDLGLLFVKLSSQGVHFLRLLLALVSACTHLRPYSVGPSAHFVVPGSTPSSSLAERHAWHYTAVRSSAVLQAPFTPLDLVQLLLALLELNGEELNTESSCTFWHHSARFTYHPRRLRNLLKNHWNTSLEN